MGWFGLLFAQLLRLVPREELAHCSGGVQVFTFGGSMLGPYLVSCMLELGHSYSVAYVCLGTFTMGGGAALLFHAPSRAAERAQAEAVEVVNRT
ncbi:hypothetical protein C7T35_21335 [Variovorax sp. WS11]|uniref:hypothetical protein n=1 Tax=Variovorax sp. WS11 TaxID=1105204 RepID=UPI000D0DEAC7|nr:hypothetical protein [Variovorax sp. WS11]NDZ18775.1 hypothetical protein [Variovorax sp. WS11]PSL82552.1 hypothetical protein C7T35_21335 [Variovorax sp. WS11]